MSGQDQRFYTLLAQRLAGRFVWVGDEMFERYGFRLVRRPRGAAGLVWYGVHHTAGGRTADDICRFHATGRHWDSPGYAVMIRADGLVEGVAPIATALTYGAGPALNGSVAHVAVIGNHQLDRPHAAMLNSLYVVLTTADDVFGSRPWRGHRELPGTSTVCPGKFLLPHLQLMRGPDWGARVPRPSEYL